MATIFEGEDTSSDMKDETTLGVRYAVVLEVNDDFIEDPDDEETERVRYGTITLNFLDYPGQQKQISITGYEKTSGDLKIPEVGSICMCIFMHNRRALILKLASGGDTVGQTKTRTLRDLVKNGSLLPLKQGEQVKWVTDSAYSYIRQCAKTIVQTIGKVLDNTFQAVQIDSKDIHYQVEHESGSKFSFDEDGNVIVTLAPDTKIYLDTVGSAVTDDDAILTRKFLTSDSIWAYTQHKHTSGSPGSPTTGPIAPVQAMPDGVSTPDVRVNRG